LIIKVLQRDCDIKLLIEVKGYPFDLNYISSFNPGSLTLTAVFISVTFLNYIVHVVLSAKWMQRATHKQKLQDFIPSLFPSTPFDIRQLLLTVDRTDKSAGRK
jgi:hypothetical protein